MSIIKNFAYYTKAVGKNKFFELQFFFNAMYFSGFEFDLKFLTETDIFFFNFNIHFISIFLSWSRKTDHAGLQLDLQILKYNFTFSLRDSRHWDGENNKWEEYI